MAIRQQSPNYRQNMLVSVGLGTNTTLTKGDAYKVIYNSGTGPITVTLPRADVGAGPFYFFNGNGNQSITIATQQNPANNIVGLPAAATLLLTGDNAYIGFYCVDGGRYAVIEDFGLSQFAFGNASGVILVGGTVYLKKAVQTSRTSTVTPSNDPELTTSLNAGTYYIKWVVRMSSAVAGSTPGCNANVNFSGTFDTNQSTGHFEGGGGAFQSFASKISAATTNTNFSSALQTFDTPVWGESLLIASTSGTLAFGWSQNTTSTSATNADIGSWMLITRLA